MGWPGTWGMLGDLAWGFWGGTQIYDCLPPLTVLVRVRAPPYRVAGHAHGAAARQASAWQGDDRLQHHGRHSKDCRTTCDEASPMGTPLPAQLDDGPVVLWPTA